MGPLGRLRSHLHATFQGGRRSLVKCSRDHMRGNVACCQSSSNADGKRGRQQQQRNGSAAALAPPGGLLPPCSLQQGQICPFDFCLPVSGSWIFFVVTGELQLFCCLELLIVYFWNHYVSFVLQSLLRIQDPPVGCTVSNRTLVHGEKKVCFLSSLDSFPRWPSLFLKSR